MAAIGASSGNTNRRRILPVVGWLQAGAAAAAGIALATAPMAAADEPAEPNPSRPSVARSIPADAGTRPAPTRSRPARNTLPAAAVAPARSSRPARAASVAIAPQRLSPPVATPQPPAFAAAVAATPQTVRVAGATARAAAVTRPAQIPSRPAAMAAAPAVDFVSGVWNFLAGLAAWLPVDPFRDLLAGAMTLGRGTRGQGVAPVVAVPATPPAPAGQNAAAQATPADPTIRLAVFGDAGNSYTNGTDFYYAPGGYRRLNLGASGPLQKAVADMMRGWNPTDVIQLGDEAYNAASSTMLDYNIGQYYNNWMYPYTPPAYTQPGSIYTDGTLGGVQAVPGQKQWPYNLYDFPNGFPNPSDPSKPGGSPDHVNHYFTVPGNHDEATILGTYNNASVNQVNFGRYYNGKPIGPDAYDYQNNIIKDPPYPSYTDRINSKVGSTQGLLDYHSYLGDGNPGNLPTGTLSIGKLDPNGYGMYYSVNLGDAGNGQPLIHLTIIDTSRLLTDAGYYAFNFAPNAQNTTRDPNTGQQTDRLTKNLDYDVRNPVTASQAWFQEPNRPLDAPSIGREMFLWAEQDLENSDAVWNIVMGHHPGYHVGNTDANAEDSYTSNAAVLNFLQGLQDDTGTALFDAYMNGHSHAYGRALEMTDSPDGIGTGIPFFTIGDGGKSLDALNLAPYGTDVLSPINFANLVGAIDGVPLYNYDINKFGTTADPNSEASAVAPYQSADPTTVGVSGYYSYSKVNWPVGTGYDPSVDPAALEITSLTVDPITGVAKKFHLEQPTYLSLLKPSQTDLSGLYGFGSGAAQIDAGDSYLMMHYKTAQPIDPAIALIGRDQGVTDFGSSTLFYNQWSPTSAKVNDLALFSFDVDTNGSLTNVQLVNNGNGYFESALNGGGYLDTTQDFEILGNNPANPLGFANTDPSRAVVQLTFSGGQLTAATLVNAGTGYDEVANAIKQCNTCGSSTVATLQDPGNNSLLVGLNIDMQAQYTLSASRPAGSEPYHDWYLMTDTSVTGGASAASGAFGAVDLSLLPTSQQARQILADTPLTTGYSGTGAQQSFAAPQSGQVRLRDSLGQLVGTAVVTDGTADVTLQRLAAPGQLRVEFDGDATSSYQVNFRGIDAADNVQLGLNYGTWTGPVRQLGSQLVLSSSQNVQVVRTDSGSGLATFGLSNGADHSLLALWAGGAESGALNAEDLFLNDPNINWQSTEGRSMGGAGSARMAAGSWTPTACLNGTELTLASLQVTANGAVARFAAGRADDTSDDVLAEYTLPGTGRTTDAQSGVLTVRRLSGDADGLALYEADAITGAVVDGNGRTVLPGQFGYLQAALDNARSAGLVLQADDMPAFGQTAVLTDLPLQLDRNYGALLMVNGSECNLLSSYAAANLFGASQALSLVTPGRGVSFGFEDRLPWQFSDRDFNDVIITLTAAVPTLTV